MDALKNVLYISYDGMTDSLGQSQVLPYLKGLSKLGYKISLISCEKPERFTQFEQQIQKICDDSKIDWHPIKYTKKPPLLSTLWDLRKMKRKAKELHRINQFQLVHCRSYIAGLAGLMMQKKYATKFVFDMRGFWADERIDGGIWKLSNPIFKFVYTYFKKKEKELLIYADQIISLTENGKTEIESWNIPRVKSNKITVIPCCVDLSIFNPEKISKEQITDLKQTLGITNKDYILGYVGSIGTWYMLPEMLDFFKVLKQEKPNTKFLFVTNENPNIIISLASTKGIQSSDMIITSCLHSEVPLHISTFDESLFFIKPSYSKKASSPTKQGEIMAMGIPLTCNSNVGDTDTIITNYCSGEIVTEFTEKAYLELLKKASLFDKEKTIKGAENYFSLENGIKKYAAIYQKLID